MLNKPTLAIILAMSWCSFPLGRTLLQGDVPHSVTPLVAMMATGLTKLVLDAMRTVASASIAVQTIILGAALSVGPMSKGTSPPPLPLAFHQFL